MRSLIIVINLDWLARVAGFIGAIALLVLIYGWTCERDIADREESRQVRK